MRTYDLKQKYFQDYGIKLRGNGTMGMEWQTNCGRYNLQNNNYLPTIIFNDKGNSVSTNCDQWFVVYVCIMKLMMVQAIQTLYIVNKNKQSLTFKVFFWWRNRQSDTHLYPKCVDFKFNHLKFRLIRESSEIDALNENSFRL